MSRIADRNSLVRNVFKHEFPLCTTCLPIYWKFDSIFDHDDKQLNNILQVMLLNIPSGMQSEDRNIRWIFDTYFYKIPPERNALHFNFVTRYYLWSPSDSDFHFNDIMDFRLHFYNEPASRLLMPSIKDVQGIEPANLRLDSIIAMIVSSTVDFFCNISRVYHMDAEILQNQVDLVFDKLQYHILKSLPDCILETPDMRRLIDIFDNTKVSLESKLSSLRELALRDKRCYRACICLSSIEDHGIVNRYSTPVTVKAKPVASREDILIARQRYGKYFMHMRL